MIDEIKFVKNSLGLKSANPDLTFFRICDGKITGTDGTLTIGSKISIDLDIAPSGAQFIKAINACKDKIILTYNNEKLQVKSGKFKANVPCIALDKVPVTLPTGREIDTKEVNILEAFKKVEKFIATDENRPFATTMLARNQSFYATNNISLIQYFVGIDLGEICIPHKFIKEVIRYNQKPEKILLDTASMTFVYENSRYITTKLSTHTFPDLDCHLLSESDSLTKLEPYFFEDIRTLEKFGDSLQRCYFKEGLISTSANPEEGASVECAMVNEGGCFNSRLLLSLEGVANTVDFSTYPKPSPFFGDSLRGVILGYRP